MRIMASQSANRVESIKLLDGRYTQSGKETLRELHRVHFPESAGEEVTLEGQRKPNLRAFAAHREDWELSKKVNDQSKIRWAISTLKPFKSAGTDGIVPALLQQEVEHLTTHLCRIFRACLPRGYIPKAWRQVKVTFIPKPGKANYTKAKAYHPISISSFMLKIMEKLVDRHIRDKILGLCPLHRYQFAYQPGKSTETALHHVITHIEEAVENSKVTLGALLDIEGAFDSTSLDIVTKAAK
jgi:hypothetical protein